MTAGFASKEAGGGDVAEERNLIDPAVRVRLRDLAEQAGAERPDAVADGLLLVMDVAFAAASMYGPDNPGRGAGDAARALLAAHTGRPRSAARTPRPSR